MAYPVLSTRALNRTRLQRQWLIERKDASAAEAIEHLVGLQAQVGDAPYYQLWSRLREFGIADLSTLLNNRQVVRVVAMRGTIHLMSAADCLVVRPLIQPFLDRTLFSSQYGKRIVGIDPAELAEYGLSLLAKAPLHNDELGEQLAAQWPKYNGNDLAYGLRCLVPLIQTPPRGVWGAGGGLTYASPGYWLGREPEASPKLDAVILRYLAAFGPASVADFQTWSYLTGTKQAFERLRPQLVGYQDETGRELFDLADAQLPDPQLPVPPKLLAPFDNLLLSYADRSFIMTREQQKHIVTQNGIVKGTVLIDGLVAGAWKSELKKRSAVIRIQAFESLAVSAKEALEAEAQNLLAFAADEAAATRIEFDAVT